MQGPREKPFAKNEHLFQSSLRRIFIQRGPCTGKIEVFVLNSSYGGVASGYDQRERYWIKSRKYNQIINQNTILIERNVHVKGCHGTIERSERDKSKIEKLRIVKRSWLSAVQTIHSPLTNRRHCRRRHSDWRVLKRRPETLLSNREAPLSAFTMSHVPSMVCLESDPRPRILI